MRLIERIRKLENRKPDIDYAAEARKFVAWIADNNLMVSTGGKEGVASE